MTAWPETKLSEIAGTTSGGTPDRKNSEYFGGSIPWIKSGELEDGFLTGSEEKITELALQNSAAKLLPVGTLLIAMYGATVGKTAILRIDAATNQAICAITPKKEHVDTEFLRFVLLHQRPEILNQRYGGAQPNISQQIIRNLSIPIPALTEQRKIAGVLGLVQRAIEQQELLLALTAELKKTLLQQLFTHGLRNEPQKQTELGLTPQTWEVTTLGKVAKFQTGGTPSRTNLDYWAGGDIPWVKTTEINYKVIEQTEELITRKGLENSAAKIFPSGTVVVAMYGQGVTRGRVGILGIDAATNQACAAITPYDEDQIASPFIYFFLEFHYEHLRQLGHGANQRNLNLALLKSFPVAFPSRDEQTEIVRTLRTLDSKLEIHQRKHATLSALFGTLLHDLMTARIRTQDVDLGLLD